jgi:hypothetical protein
VTSASCLVGSVELSGGYRFIRKLSQSPPSSRIDKYRRPISNAEESSVGFANLVSLVLSQLCLGQEPGRFDLALAEPRDFNGARHWRHRIARTAAVDPKATSYWR